MTDHYNDFQGGPRVYSLDEYQELEVERDELRAACRRVLRWHNAQVMRWGTDRLPHPNWTVIVIPAIEEAYGKTAAEVEAEDNA